MQLMKAYEAETSNSCNQVVIGATYLLKINLHLSNNIYQCSNEPLQHYVECACVVEQFAVFTRYNIILYVSHVMLWCSVLHM